MATTSFWLTWHGRPPMSTNVKYVWAWLSASEQSIWLSSRDSYLSFFNVYMCVCRRCNSYRFGCNRVSPVLTHGDDAKRDSTCLSPITKNVRVYRGLLLNVMFDFYLYFLYFISDSLRNSSTRPR